MAASRHNRFADPVLGITIIIQSGKTIRLVTNDLDAPVEEIAGLYNARWQIELFFRWSKQNLKIQRFLGTSEKCRTRADLRRVGLGPPRAP